jgi:NADPH:quinone reductase-like Zn-dependent oxidoreductase
MAIVQDSTGKPVLTHSTLIPELQPGTLLVRRVAVATNTIDYKMGLAFPSPSTIIGGDIAGYVVVIDPEAQAVRPDAQIVTGSVVLFMGPIPRTSRVKVSLSTLVYFHT